jgi:hypothetical protein
MEVEVVVEADLAARVISAAQGCRWTVLRLLVWHTSGAGRLLFCLCLIFSVFL